MSRIYKCSFFLGNELTTAGRVMDMLYTALSLSSASYSYETDQNILIRGKSSWWEKICKMSGTALRCRLWPHDLWVKFPINISSLGESCVKYPNVTLS